ncbi:unnamed protein product, partial [Polarella glacialis]
ILKMWEYLGRHRSEECDWYLKADPDTYVNLRALSDRLSCFDAEEQHYLGVVHAAVPPRDFQEQWPALYFGHGGSGYLVSRGLVSFIGRLAGPCLEDVMAATDGDAMEDVIFALCLRKQGVEVMSYGFLAQGGTRVWSGEEISQ